MPDDLADTDATDFAATVPAASLAAALDLLDVVLAQWPEIDSVSPDGAMIETLPVRDSYLRGWRSTTKALRDFGAFRQRYVVGAP